MKTHSQFCSLLSLSLTLLFLPHQGGAAEQTLPHPEDTPGARGDAAFELGDYDTATEEYQKLLSSAPDLAAYQRAAELLWVKGDQRKARLVMQKAIDTGGTATTNLVADAKARLAMMLMDGGSLMPAEQLVRQALAETPDNASLLLASARFAIAHKDYTNALAILEKVVANQPDHESLVALGDLYSVIGRGDDADKTYERLLSMHLKESSGKTYMLNGGQKLARFYADHDRNLDQAMALAQAAYGMSKSVAIADTLAWCQYKKGLHVEARKTIRQALRWKTPDAAMLFHAGMIYAKLQDRPTARQYLYRALSLNPHWHPTEPQLAADQLDELSHEAQTASLATINP